MRSCAPSSACLTLARLRCMAACLAPMRAHVRTGTHPHHALCVGSSPAYWGGMLYARPAPLHAQAPRAAGMHVAAPSRTFNNLTQSLLRRGACGRGARAGDVGAARCAHACKAPISARTRQLDICHPLVITCMHAAAAAAAAAPCLLRDFGRQREQRKAGKKASEQRGGEHWWRRISSLLPLLQKSEVRRCAGGRTSECTRRCSPAAPISTHKRRSVILRDPTAVDTLEGAEVPSAGGAEASARPLDLAQPRRDVSPARREGLHACMHACTYPGAHTPPAAPR